MPPEQARGEIDAIDARYGRVRSRRDPARAAVRRAAVSRGGSGGDAAARRAAERHEPRGGAHIPRELRAVVRSRALAPRQAERYPSMHELAGDIRAFLEGRRGSAWRDGWVARVVKRARRHPAQTVTGAAVVLLLLLAWAGYGQLRVARAERVLRAQEQQRREASNGRRPTAR
jgi:hypothetical protein